MHGVHGYMQDGYGAKHPRARTVQEAAAVLKMKLWSRSPDGSISYLLVKFVHPPLGAEVVWEFQEFQKFISKDENASRKSKDKNVRRHAFILFRTQSLHVCPIDLGLQMFNFPHLSIHQEVFTSHYTSY